MFIWIEFACPTSQTIKEIKIENKTYRKKEKCRNKRWNICNILLCISFFILNSYVLIGGDQKWAFQHLFHYISIAIKVHRNKFSRFFSQLIQVPYDTTKDNFFSSFWLFLWNTECRSCTPEIVMIKFSFFPAWAPTPTQRNGGVEFFSFFSWLQLWLSWTKRIWFFQRKNSALEHIAALWFYIIRIFIISTSNIKSRRDSVILV